MDDSKQMKEQILEKKGWPKFVKKLALSYSPNHLNFNCCQRTPVDKQVHSVELIMSDHFNNTKLSKNTLAVLGEASFINLSHAKDLKIQDQMLW